MYFLSFNFLNDSRMLVDYKVYRKSIGDKTPIVSLHELMPQMLCKSKYTGKKAKIEAIKRLTGVILPQDYTTQQVNDYLSNNLFNTSLWRKYRNTLEIVMSEKDVFSVDFEYQYTIEVDIDESQVTDTCDERLIHHITCELMGAEKEEYRGLKNPILSLTKKYPKMSN